MFNVRLAGGDLYGKQLFTWLSLVVSLMASFVLSFFPLDVLDEISGLNWVSFWGVSYLFFDIFILNISVLKIFLPIFKYENYHLTFIKHFFNT